MTEDGESRSNDFWFILIFTMLLLIYLSLNPISLEFFETFSWSNIINTFPTKLLILVSIGFGMLIVVVVIYIAIERYSLKRLFR